jgi:glycosyltransferase involved in cell wall biosynthesis
MSEWLPFISVITPTHMRADGVEKAVRSALAQTYPPDRYEIIVIDSGSTDGTADRIADLAREHPGRIVFLPQPPLGPSASRNAGASAAKGEILAFLDSDCEADPDWIRNGVKPFAGRPGLGMVQGRTLPPPGARLTTRSRFVRVEKSNCVHDGCNMFYRKQAFDSVSGFSREFYMDCKSRNSIRFVRWLEHYWLVMLYSGEDSELGWRVLSNNWEKEFCANALVYHEVRYLTFFSWIVDEGCYSFGVPRLIGRYPCLRRCIYKEFFLNRAQAFLPLLLCGLVLSAVLHPATLLLAAPYVYHRSSEPSRFWRGILRPLRSMVYLPRDFATFLILVASSIRHRRWVL